jgi:DNA-binding XRE family transcriptional regulator
MTPLLAYRDGVKIEIYSKEHLPLHIHAHYGEFEALIEIKTGHLIAGSLPPKKLRLVRDWITEPNRRKQLEKKFYELNPRLVLGIKKDNSLFEPIIFYKMSLRTFRGIPRILKINAIDAKNLRLSVLFSTGENRILEFHKILTEIWQVKPNEPDYKLLKPNEFAKVELVGNTLSWSNIEIPFSDMDDNPIVVPFDVGADVLYKLSIEDPERSHSIGKLFKSARLAANMTQEQVALLSGTSRTYITKLENDTQDIELMTLFKIVEGGLNKKLKITIE